MPAYSGSLYFNISSIINNCSPGDEITIELVTNNRPASNNWTASMDYGNLTIDIQSTSVVGYPYASSGTTFGNFVYTIVSPSTIVLNSSLTSFLTNYQQVPYFVSASQVVTSSLYSQYGEINYPFSLSYGDKIVLTSVEGRSQVVVISNYTITNNRAYISVYPDINNYFINYPNNIASFLVVKRLQDEQNIILTFKKPPGATSYGFVIPEDVDLNLLNNISAIQSNVQQQLLSTQQNSDQ